MPSILEYDSYKYVTLSAMLLAILVAYLKGRGAITASGRSLGWTHVPLIAFVIASLGPSVLAILVYLGYKSGFVQPPPSGYGFSTFIQDLPLDFAVMNWPFVALYVTCRLWPNFGSARSAMWLSVVAMSLPNVLLFSLAPTMVSSVFDAGQGIGVIEAVLILPIIVTIWPGPAPGIFDAGYGIGFAITALAAPIPFLGVTAWLAGQLIGWTASTFGRKPTVRS